MRPDAARIRGSPASAITSLIPVRCNGICSPGQHRGDLVDGVALGPQLDDPCFGAPTATLSPTKTGSWVWGVGNDSDRAITRTVGANQIMVDEYLAPVGDTFWVQRQTAPSTGGSLAPVTINDTAPTTDRWNLAVIEIPPATVVNPPPDTTPPLISTVAAGAIGPTQATINWTTSEPATTQVSYGATSAYGTDTALNAAPTTSHSQVLSRLTASTTYHYRVRSADAAGNVATSPDATFTTAALSSFTLATRPVAQWCHQVWDWKTSASRTVSLAPARQRAVRRLRYCPP